MRTSLIISTYNWPEALDLVLKSVLFQSVTVDEIIIADDGSSNSTKLIFEKYKNIFLNSINHIWHQDIGFRKTKILNKAFVASSGDYIIQIDGDIILHEHFIKDHIKSAEKNKFIHGGRVFLNEKITLERLRNKNINFHFFNRGVNNRINTIYSPFLSNFFSYKSTTLRKTRGCNFSCWKKDFEKINGYNEDMLGWGLEDSELSARLINNGLFKKRLKFTALTYHLHHDNNSKSDVKRNLKILKNSVANKIIICNKGINQNKVS
tara:strand:+ start:1026 stop:1817 length:792 start_codon:yes stop_codon:yes gene_type:complete